MLGIGENQIIYSIKFLTGLFFFILFTHLVFNFPNLFLKKHGRQHSLTGLIYLIIIVIGLLDSFDTLPTSLKFPDDSYRVFLDFFLGVSGCLLPLTAATDFGHKQVKNFASGTLDKHATVSYSEMIEHSFYQIVNLFQIIFFHIISYNSNIHKHLYMRVLYVVIVTSPWLFRDNFPVNKFSDNYDKIDEKSNTYIRILYRIKKYQYVFYKHFVLHGLNITVAIHMSDLATNSKFRIFWMLLNTSYTMEFFLQSLVKKDIMLQEILLVMQNLLMIAASLSATFVLKFVDFKIAIVSLLLNFIHRKHDFLNTVFLSCLLLFCSSYFPM